MSMRRKNKGTNRHSRMEYELWFYPNKRRQRRRNEIAIASRRKNRK